MSWETTGIERRRCPEVFAERLARAGGLNRYGQPNYKMLWGQTATYRSGGMWEHDGFVGYRDVLLGDGSACWLLCEWRPASEYGSPFAYYFENYDPVTGLQQLGGYPYQGRYEILHKLQHKEVKNGTLRIDAMPLSAWIVDAIVPLIRLAKLSSLAERRAAIAARRDREEAEKLERVRDSLDSARLRFKSNPVSYSGQRHRSTAASKRCWEMARQMDAVMKRAASMRGLGGFAQISNAAAV